MNNRSEWLADHQMQPRETASWQRASTCPLRNMTDRQRHEHAKQAAAMRAGKLRGIPTAFQALGD